MSLCGRHGGPISMWHTPCTECDREEENERRHREALDALKKAEAAEERRHRENVAAAERAEAAERDRQEEDRRREDEERELQRMQREQELEEERERAAEEEARWGDCGRCGQRFLEEKRVTVPRGRTWPGLPQSIIDEGICPKCYYDAVQASERDLTAAEAEALREREAAKEERERARRAERERAQAAAEERRREYERVAEERRRESEQSAARSRALFGILAGAVLGGVNGALWAITDRPLSTTTGAIWGTLIGAQLGYGMCALSKTRPSYLNAATGVGVLGCGVSALGMWIFSPTGPSWFLRGLVTFFELLAYVVWRGGSTTPAPLPEPSLRKRGAIALLLATVTAGAAWLSGGAALPHTTGAGSSSTTGSTAGPVAGNEQPAGSAADPRPGGPTGPAPGNNAAALGSARASSSLRPNPPEAAFDDSESTAWCEAAPGDGTRQWIEATFKPGFSPAAIEVAGGWAYNSPIAAERAGGSGDMWELSNVATELEISWDGGSTRVAFNRTERGIRKRVSLPASSRRVRVTATAVSRGAGGNNLCLDGLTVFGSATEAPAPTEDGPGLAPEDEHFADSRSGGGWSDRCYLHIVAGRLGRAKAACERGMAAPGLTAWTRGALLYNLGLIAEKQSDFTTARRRYEESLSARPEGAGVETVRKALAALQGK